MSANTFTLRDILWELKGGYYLGTIGGDIAFTINSDFSLEIFIGSFGQDPQTKRCKSLVEAQGLAQHYLLEEALAFVKPIIES